MDEAEHGVKCDFCELCDEGGCEGEREGACPRLRVIVVMAWSSLAGGDAPSIFTSFHRGQPAKTQIKLETR